MRDNTNTWWNWVLPEITIQNANRYIMIRFEVNRNNICWTLCWKLYQSHIWWVTRNMQISNSLRITRWIIEIMMALKLYWDQQEHHNNIIFMLILNKLKLIKIRKTCWNVMYYILCCKLIMPLHRIRILRRF